MAQIKLAEYTFDNSVGDCLPTLTPNTITMTKEDSVNGTITKRIIYIDDTTLPTRISFQNKTSLLTLDYLNFTNTITNASNMFNGCGGLTSLNTSNWNTSNVTKMNSMFGGCSKLTSLDLSNFDTSKVNNMINMFHSCKSLTSLDLSNFNTSNITMTFSMFANCS